MRKIKFMRKYKQSKGYNERYVCESEFIQSDPTYPHLSFLELTFYRNIPIKSLKNEENHSLSIQRNLNTNQYEVIKKYKKDIPKNMFKNIKEETPCEAFTILSQPEIKCFLDGALNVVYSSRGLWEAVKKAEEFFSIYYSDDDRLCIYKKCKHKKSKLAPCCLLQKELPKDML